MKYETPELTALTPAISAIQGSPTKYHFTGGDGPDENEATGVYQDWE
jgi:hypothetical protein